MRDLLRRERGRFHTLRSRKQTSSRDTLFTHLRIHSCPWTLKTQNLLGGLGGAPEIMESTRGARGCRLAGSGRPAELCSILQRPTLHGAHSLHRHSSQASRRPLHEWMDPDRKAWEPATADPAARVPCHLHALLHARRHCVPSPNHMQLTTHLLCFSAMKLRVSRSDLKEMWMLWLYE